MDLFTSQHSPVSDPDVPLIAVQPYQCKTIKTESMSAWPYTDPPPYTPQLIHTDLDTYCTDTPTYLSLSPAEVDTVGQAFSVSSDYFSYEQFKPALIRMEEDLFISNNKTFSVPTDYLSYEYKPAFIRTNDDVFINTNKDEGYVSPSSSLHSLTPPSDLRQLNVRDSANESGNSNDLTGLYDTEQQFRLSDSSTPPQPPRTQCVKCGSVVDIAQCLKDTTGHYLCYSCHVQSNPIVPVQAAHEEPAQKRTRKKQSAVTGPRNQICQNCECPNTTLWRRSFSGEAVCNACGLYEKLHKRKRPKSMRKDTIQTRRRKPRNSESQKKKMAIESAVAMEANRVVSQPMPSHPPPPYNSRNIVDSNNYQVLPPMGSLGFLNTYPYGATYSHYSQQ